MTKESHYLKRRSLDSKDGIDTVDKDKEYCRITREGALDFVKHYNNEKEHGCPICGGLTYATGTITSGTEESEVRINCIDCTFRVSIQDWYMYSGGKGE